MTEKELIQGLRKSSTAAYKHINYILLGSQESMMTDCHPYYSQQLAASVWQTCVLTLDEKKPLECAIEHIVTTHGLDFERQWMVLLYTLTDMNRRIRFSNGGYL